jgi:hypothetical protein
LINDQNRRYDLKKVACSNSRSIRQAPDRRGRVGQGNRQALCRLRHVVLGSINRGACDPWSLFVAMNRIGGKSNTGEGGEDPNRYPRNSST